MYSLFCLLLRIGTYRPFYCCVFLQILTKAISTMGQQHINPTNILEPINVFSGLAANQKNNPGRTPRTTHLYGSKNNRGRIRLTTQLCGGKITKVIPFQLPHDKINKMAVRPAKTQISLGICPV